MDLLTSADKAEIRASLGDVFDTFFKTPVIFEQGKDSLDRFQEDRPDRFSPAVTLRSLVEYPDGSSEWVKLMEQGALNESSVKVILSVRDLVDTGLISPTDWKVNMTSEEDRFTINTIVYTLKFFNYDGPLERENVLLIVYGTKAV